MYICISINYLSLPAGCCINYWTLQVINQPWHVKGNLLLCPAVLLPYHHLCMYVRAYVCTYVPLAGNPMIVTYPPPLIAVEANRAICLVCYANSVNDPEVNWLRGNMMLHSESENGYNITADRENVRLSHFVVLSTASADAGMYQCRAENFISSATEDFRISVISPSGQFQHVVCN